MSDANTQLKVTVTAEDKASGVFSNMGGTMGKLGEIAGATAKIIGTGLVAAAGTFAAFGVESFHAAIDAEESMKQATKALQITFDDLTKKEVSNLKKELGTSTVSFSQVEQAMNSAAEAATKLAYDDEDASKAFAKLFSITKDVTKSQSELKIAMDLAAYSGTSLESAVDALTMVHAGGTRVLKEFGIQVKEGTTSAQALALVQDKVAGSAEAMAGTMQGRMMQLDILWGNFKETVGASIIEAVLPFISILSEWAQKPETQQRIQDLAAGFANFAKQITPIIEKLLPAFITFMEYAGKSIMVVVGFLFKTLPDAIATAIFAVQQIIDKLTAFIIKLDEAINKVKTFFATAGGQAEGASWNPLSPSFQLPYWIPGARANGGPVSGGSPYIVGEQGPELFVPGGSGSIIPNHALGGGVVVNVYGDVSGSDLIQKVRDAIMNDLNLNMKI